MKSITSAILFATFFTSFSMHFNDTTEGKDLALVSMLLAATTLGMTIYFICKGK